MKDHAEEESTSDVSLCVCVCWFVCLAEDLQLSQELEKKRLFFYGVEGTTVGKQGTGKQDEWVKAS